MHRSYTAYVNSEDLPVIEDTTLISAYNENGDSGGVVYDASNRVIGSVSGQKRESGEFVFCIVSKAANTFESLNCSVFPHPYT